MTVIVIKYNGCIFKAFLTTSLLDNTSVLLSQYHITKSTNKKCLYQEGTTDEPRSLENETPDDQSKDTGRSNVSYYSYLRYR